jgi:regulator of nucleoside diphosphate kinase
MSKGEIFITKVDQERLLLILSKAISLQHEDRVLLKKLEEELTRAHIVEPKDIPPDVVTMNSEVCIEDVDTKEEEAYTVVFPGQANYQERKISVLAPVGTALLGYRVGDVIEWEMPRGIRKLKIKKVLCQPEAHQQDLS